jgi:hypothetical protein
MSLPEVRAVSQVVLRFSIAAIWLIAAIGKLRSPLLQRELDVQRLVAIAPVQIKVIARLLPVAELLLVIWLVSGWWAAGATGTSAALFLLFAWLLAAAAIKGAVQGAGGCGCFGGFMRTSGKPSPDSMMIAMNFMLAILSISLTTARFCNCRAIVG